MIYTKLHGRIGNHLFEMAAAATLAYQHNDEWCAVCHKDYLIASPDKCYIWEFVQPYLNNIYRNVQILESQPTGLKEFRQKGFHYTPIPYYDGILLNGGFQSYKYFNESIVRELFSIPPEIREEIIRKYGEIVSKRNVVGVNVRRGDYCVIPHKFPVCSKTYFMKAMSYFPKDSHFLFISDDIAWCKANFKGDNYFFVEDSTPLEDLYIQTMCEHNIISNSSFSWWGGYLNPNPKKIIIAPKNWFGISSETRHHDVKDLLPPSYIKIYNRMEWKLLTKSYVYYFREILINYKQKMKTILKPDFLCLK